MDPYVTSGTTIAPCLGRQRALGRVRERLERETPAHISIIAPKLYGKTVLATRVAELMRQDDSGFAAVAVVDLRHGTPNTDAEFRNRLADELRAVIDPLEPDLAKELRDASDDLVGEMLQMVLETFGDGGRRVLVVFDAFDYVPIGAGVTANLLDQLRSLAQLPSVYFAITSRRPLRELCKNAASRSSDFWRVFGEPIRFGAFDADDWDELWRPIRENGGNVLQSAVTELKSWSGGIPTLAACVLEEVHRTASDGGDIDNEVVASACQRAEQERPETIADIWDSCPVECQQILIAAAQGSVPVDQVDPQIRRTLTEQGLAIAAGGNLKHSSRCIQSYARDRSAGLEDLTRLFGNDDTFPQNAMRLLELRLAAIGGAEVQLAKSLEYAIRDLCDGEDGPRRTLDAARGIVELALDEAWRAEGLEGTTNAPDAWESTWVDTQGLTMPDGIRPLPVERGQRCRLLRLVSGRDRSYFRVAQCISRQTSMLLDQLNDFGTIANHAGGETVRFGTALLMCCVGVQLVESLVQDQ